LPPNCASSRGSLLLSLCKSRFTINGIGQPASLHVAYSAFCGARFVLDQQLIMDPHRCLMPVASKKRFHLAPSRLGCQLCVFQTSIFPRATNHRSKMSLSPLANSISHGKKEVLQGLRINSKLVQALILLVACVLFGANLNYASFPPGTVIDIKLGDVALDQFSYTPTRDGYEFK